MSGDENSTKPKLTIKDRLEQLNKVLDADEEKLGLPKFGFANIENEASKILSMRYDVLEKLSSTECGEKGWALQNFAFHIQRAINRKNAEAKWAEASFLKSIGSKLATVPGYSFEERKVNASKDNDAAMEYHKIMLNAHLRVERMSFLSTKIDSMARTLLELQKNKRNRGDDE